MQTIIHFANLIFKPIIDLGAPPIMLIVLTLIAWAIGVKFSRALEGGIKLAIALTAISDIINLLTTQYQSALNAFVKSTNIVNCYRCWLGTTCNHHMGFALYLILSSHYDYC